MEAFHELGAEEREIITDKASGKDIGRPGYQALKTTLLRSGDTLIVTSWEDVPAMIEDAKKCWLEAMLENELIQERDRNR